MTIATQTAKIYLKQMHDGQLSILKDKTRFRVVCCGRRFGKTEAAITACTYRLLKGQKIWYCSPTNRNSKMVWRKIKTTFREYPGVYINNSDKRLELPNGAFIEMVSLHEADNLRGEGLDFVVIDEAAYVSDGVWDAVLRPMLLSDKGEALLQSSPNGHNYFWRLYMQGLDPAFTSWSSHRYSSYDNPLLDPLEIDEIRLATPERLFQQEYLAEFIDDAGGVFRGVADVCTLPQRTPYSGDFVMGVDWAKSHDFTVISLIDRSTRQQVFMDRFNQVSWEVQRGRLIEIYRQWKPSVIYAESNSIGEPNIEALQREGIPVRPFETTALSKTPLIDALSLAIERKELTLLNNDVQRAELQAYQMERLPSGKYRYGSPDGGHDDTVMALALAWHGCYTSKRLLLWE